MDAAGPVIGFLPAIDAAYASIAGMTTIGDRGLEASRHAAQGTMT